MAIQCYRWGVGTLLALLMDLGAIGLERKWEVEPVSLVLAVAAGVIIGVIYALLHSLPVEVVAQLIDRRAELKDRVTTALLCSETPFTEPL
ncbi:MAG: hypothetical protein ACUVTP_10765 [Candidatus Fervidibacter sp.]|uniref:hypothetical protein n=1 Tax=Candidatus Fervidibacter sp. TaxID=3100871 RepID=UPI00404AE4E2